MSNIAPEKNYTKTLPNIHTDDLIAELARRVETMEAIKFYPKSLGRLVFLIETSAQDQLSKINGVKQ